MPRNDIEWEVIDTIVDLPINDTNRLVVDVNKGGTMITIGVREWYTPDDGENWYPGKKGMTLRPDQWAKIAPAIAEWCEANPPEPTAVTNRSGGRKLGVAKKPATKKASA